MAKATKKKAGTATAEAAPAGTSGARRRTKPAAAAETAAPVMPVGTPARLAEVARASVWAVSSEKTTDQFSAAEELARQVEVERTQALADPGAEPVAAELRRGPRDLYAFFRAELLVPEQPDDPQAAWRRANARQRHELFPGRSVAELKAVEEQLGLELPPSFWDFSLEWSGGLLFVREGGTTRVIGPHQLIDEVRGPLAGTMSRPFLPLVDLGCGDYLALDTGKAVKGGESPLVWWFQGEPRRKVAESFGAWLKRYVEARGEPYWLR